ncbi:S phase cyclin A-associated protein in the endoplasmic reticulum-like isoform X3 [Ruditapes philippinarum]|uniref:S phase cyclin A-associated protein in the endoplasmic reticulum-like isoform X3 n=1 Tax=Ruditapes philippinarum TaxID=129788 RepID=UPI00295B3077|nr:S phase cyclin A-associated protein in the endoplasmic reticulum-like isoform X3 [Ruditapes philippinarum]
MSDARRKRYPGAPKMRSENGGQSHRPQSGSQTTGHRGRNNNAHGANYRDGMSSRMNTSDRVKKIVQEEGRTARNLVIYHVPVQDNQLGTDRSRARQARNKPVPKEANDLKSSFKSDLTKSPKSDGGKKPDLRARYWKFLFDNLQRAVDAIYETCEQDESALECREVIMMLVQSTKDFQSLIDRLHVQKEFEQATKEGDRPTSIAWEVRKMSPGKSPSGMSHRTSPSPAQRALNFSYPEQNVAVKPSPPSTGNSWADRVKGIAISPVTDSSREVTPLKDHPVLPEPPVLSPVPSSLTESDSYREINESEEDDGWETVHRGGKTKSWGSPSQRSLENLHTVIKNEHHKLTRSVSEPNASIKKYQKRTNHSKVNNKVTTKGGTSPPLDTHGRSNEGERPEIIPNGDISKPLQRPRTDSKDSEKENRPSLNSVSEIKKTDNIINKKSPGLPRRSVESRYKASKDLKDPNNKSNTSRTKPHTRKPSAKGTDVTKDAGKGTKQTDMKEEDINSKSSSGSLTELNAVASKGKNDSTEKDIKTVLEDMSEGKGIDVMETEDVDNVDVDQDEDTSVRQIDDALATAEDAENCLQDEWEKEQNQALESAIQEEESWLKNTMSSLEASTPGTLDWDAMVAEYDAAERSGQSKDWGEMVDEADTRTPGHAVHMHEKLSSPSRKRSPTESKKRHEEKQAKAQELRDKLMQEKSERLRILGLKVEEVRAWKEELMRQKKEMIERKMQQAEEKRQTMLKSKAQKAHDEEAKANEIAFINSLEAQNKRLEMMSKQQESEARLQDIQDERQRKHEEKLAKEAAVEERRKTLQAERLARLQEIKERRKIKDARVEQQKAERETERQDALRAKEKDREERLAALNAQHEQQKQELQKKIQQKQVESSQRHMEALKQIKEKAFEMSILRHSTEDHNDAPELTPYAVGKMCTICNALIPSEVYLLSHLRGKTHQQALRHNNNGNSMTKQEIETFNLKHIVNAPDNNNHPKIVSEKERIKSLKKRCKKLKQRMHSRGLEYENSLIGKQPVVESDNKAKMQKVIRDINKYLQSTESGPWSQSRVSALDRALGELNRIFDKKVFSDQGSFRHLGGLTTLSRIIQLVDIANIQTQPPVPQKSLVLTCQVLKQACKGNYDNCHHMMFSNKISLIIELTIHQLSLMMPTEQATSSNALTTEPPKLPHNLLSINLLQLLTIILTCLAKNSPSTKSSEASLERMSNTVDTFTSRGNDILSYIISVGIVDKLTQYLRMVQGPIDSDKDAAEFIQNCLGLLVALTKFLSVRKSSIFENKKLEDPTQLISTFEVTELVGIVSLLYGMLLHSGTPSRGEEAPPEFPQHTLGVATTGLRMLNHMATLDLDMMQSTLGQEGMSLEFRHIASYLIWYCSHHNAEELLHEVILCVGYFTVRNSDNQVVIQSGQPPTVLQQMCSLPFQYFSDPRLVNILFPTLISSCYNNQANREILEQELSCVLLSNFIEEKQLEVLASQPLSSKKSSDKEKRESKEADLRTTLAYRFPSEQWTAAQEYFKIS